MSEKSCIWIDWKVTWFAMVQTFSSSPSPSSSSPSIVHGYSEINHDWHHSQHSIFWRYQSPFRWIDFSHNNSSRTNSTCVSTEHRSLSLFVPFFLTNWTDFFILICVQVLKMGSNSSISFYINKPRTFNSFSNCITRITCRHHKTIKPNFGINNKFLKKLFNVLRLKNFN